MGGAMLPLAGMCVVTESCPAAMRSKRDGWNINQFHILKRLGQGYASTVCLGTCSTSGIQCGIKMYHRSKLSDLNYFQIAREIRIHGQLEHQHILQLWAAFEDPFGIYLVSEYAAKGDVFSDVERRGGKLSESEAVCQIIFPFLCALQYLHGNNIIHRDIKPENLLLNAMGVLKVADFGLCINCGEERPVTRVGTLDYMCPEVLVCPDKSLPLENKEHAHLAYTPLVDAWAVGVLAYELLLGKAPFDRGNKKATVTEIMHGEVTIPAGTMSEGAQAFIRCALVKDVRKRPGVVELQDHPWIAEHIGAQLKPRRPMLRAGSFHGRSQLMQGLLDVEQDEDPMQVDPQPNEETLRAMQFGAGNRLMHQTTMSTSGADLMHYRDVRISAMRPGPGGAGSGTKRAATTQISAEYPVLQAGQGQGQGQPHGSLVQHAPRPLPPALQPDSTLPHKHPHLPYPQQPHDVSSALAQMKVNNDSFNSRKTVSFAVVGDAHVGGSGVAPHPPAAHGPHSGSSTPRSGNRGPSRSRSLSVNEMAAQARSANGSSSGPNSPGTPTLTTSKSFTSRFAAEDAARLALGVQEDGPGEPLRSTKSQASPGAAHQAGASTSSCGGALSICVPPGGEVPGWPSSPRSQARSQWGPLTSSPHGLLPSLGGALVPTRLGSQSGALPGPQASLSSMGSHNSLSDLAIGTARHSPARGSPVRSQLEPLVSPGTMATQQRKGSLPGSVPYLMQLPPPMPGQLTSARKDASP